MDHAHIRQIELCTLPSYTLYSLYNYVWLHKICKSTMGIILQGTIAQCHVPVYKVSKVAESGELLIRVRV